MNDFSDSLVESSNDLEYFSEERVCKDDNQKSLSNFQLI